ncbi:hypothetical protein JYU34_016171 [Plutella xylostella]|uniref:Uncharacterized protein n=1 Tax=Plutella xylostella TaxID=51655 RepID=A0ABQ7Q5L7_PLUXY|nr:hypothetical protein JYU34_016171 [Plutella xylostella]
MWAVGSPWEGLEGMLQVVDVPSPHIRGSLAHSSSSTQARAASSTHPGPHWQRHDPQCSQATALERTTLPNPVEVEETTEGISLTKSEAAKVGPVPAYP